MGVKQRLPVSVRRVLSRSRRRAASAMRRVPGKSNTRWDNYQNEEYFENDFLNDEIEGIEHPSRQYVRRWLTERPGLSVLDIPCGPGVEYNGLRRDNVPVGSYCGMDFSDRMLRIVGRKFPEADFRRGDITAIPVPRDSFDVVLCRHILEHLDDWRPAIVEALRVARNRVLIVLFRLPTGSERRRQDHGAWDNRIDLAQLTAFIVAQGAEIVSVVETPFDRPVGSETNTVVEVAPPGAAVADGPVVSE